MWGSGMSYNQYNTIQSTGGQRGPHTVGQRHVLQSIQYNTINWRTAGGLTLWGSGMSYNQYNTFTINWRTAGAAHCGAAACPTVNTIQYNQLENGGGPHTVGQRHVLQSIQYNTINWRTAGGLTLWGSGMSYNTIQSTGELRGASQCGAAACPTVNTIQYNQLENGGGPHTVGQRHVLQYNTIQYNQLENSGGGGPHTVGQRHVLHAIQYNTINWRTAGGLTLWGSGMSYNQYNTIQSTGEPRGLTLWGSGMSYSQYNTIQYNQLENRGGLTVWGSGMSYNQYNTIQSTGGQRGASQCGAAACPTINTIQYNQLENRGGPHTVGQRHVLQSIQYNTINWRTAGGLTLWGSGMSYSQYNTIQSTGERRGASRCWAAACPTINTIQCNAMQCNAMQCNAMQCNAMQCNAMQCNAMQCNAMQCNAIQSTGERRGPHGVGQRHVLQSIQYNTINWRTAGGLTVWGSGMSYNQYNTIQSTGERRGASHCGAAACPTINTIQYNQLENRGGPHTVGQRHVLQSIRYNTINWRTAGGLTLWGSGMSYNQYNTIQSTGEPRGASHCGAAACPTINTIQYNQLENRGGPHTLGQRHVLHAIQYNAMPGLDIGYVPAGPDAFFRWSGQFGPQQLIFYWPAGPVFYFYFFIIIFFLFFF